jgi:hypothetical protein
LRKQSSAIERRPQSLQAERPCRSNSMAGSASPSQLEPRSTVPAQAASPGKQHRPSVDQAQVRTSEGNSPTPRVSVMRKIQFARNVCGISIAMSKVMSDC